MKRTILVLEPGRPVCPSRACDRVASLLSSDGAQVWTASRLNPEEPGPRPDLLVVRASATGLSMLGDIRPPSWRSVPLLGILCARNAAEALDLADSLDDFLVCPAGEMEMALRIRRLLQRSPAPARPASRSGLEALIGESEPFVRVLDRIPRLADADAPVLITGETGTGKELVARAIHYRSPRKGKPFVPLNCGAMPETLVENELFGHARGAFTGASSSEEGLFAEAEGGTLFLDEVDSLGPGAQVKLLRFLQTWEYRPLGSTRLRKADLRVVAATNADLPRLVAERRFREDLYYRLNILCLHLPPLRERTGDVPLLASRLLERFSSRQGSGPLRFSEDALRHLAEYRWPGNVRELEAVIHRTALLSQGPLLRAQDLEVPGPRSGPERRDGGLREARARAVEQTERACVLNALAAHRGNVSRAAASVGKERRSFQRLMRKHAIDRNAFLG